MEVIKIKQLYNKRWMLWLDDGEAVDANVLRKQLGLSSSTLVGGLRERRNNKQKQLDYVNDLIWKIENKLSVRISVYKNPDGCRCVAQFLREIFPGHKHKNLLYYRLRKWSEGSIDTDKLFEPPGHRMTRIQEAMKKAKEKRRYHWEENRPRHIQERRLAAIPGPTDIERKLWGY